jgi:hypothetical protein
MDAKRSTVSVYVYIFFTQDTRTEKDCETQIIECSGEMNLLGSLASRVFLHQKATIQEAEQVIYGHRYL